MNTRRGRDGKTYPATRKPDDLARLVGIEHALACREGLSRRQVQRRMLFRHGIRRSLGAISQDLSRYECDKCAARPAPVPAERPAVISWR